MDVLSIVGVVLGLSAVLLGNAIEGGHLAGLLNLPAMVIVLGGTLAATMVQTPLSVFRRALLIFSWIFRPPVQGIEAGIGDIVSWSNIARRDGLLGLEIISESVSDPFTRKGLELLVDGSEPETLRRMMENDIWLDEQRDMAAARVFEGMGGYSPTIGIIGAVMGLIHVMSNLADPSKLGPGIATAFVATIYGVGLANLLFLPFGSKLKSVVADRSRYQEMMLLGLIAIAEGENPRAIEIKLISYLDGNARAAHEKVAGTD